MKSLKIAVLALLVAGVVYAARDNFVDLVNSPKAQQFISGIYIGSRADDPTSSTLNKMATHLCATKVYDFPTLGGASAALDTVCAESSALTITGCGFGDRISMGIDQAPVNAFGNLNAYLSAANTAKVRACAVGITDGGSFDMPDASYTICCDGN